MKKNNQFLLALLCFPISCNVISQQEEDSDRNPVFANEKQYMESFFVSLKKFGFPEKDIKNDVNFRRAGESLMKNGYRLNRAALLHTRKDLKNKNFLYTFLINLCQGDSKNSILQLMMRKNFIVKYNDDEFDE